MGLTNWDLLKVVRDANVVRGAQRHVLFALCMRADTRKNFTCFPSYAQLVEDTSVSMSRVKSAVRELQEGGWVRRQSRGRTSNLFFINVPALHQAAEKRRQELSAGVPKATDDLFGAGIYGNTDDRDNTDGLEAAPEAQGMPDWLEACVDTDMLVEVLRQQYLDHPIFADPRGKEYLKADMERCIELAGTSFRCGHILYWAYKNPGIRTAVGASKKLGLYILKCFPQWLVTFRNQLVDMNFGLEEEE